MKKVILNNDFHGTKAVILVHDYIAEEFEVREYLSFSASDNVVRRLGKKLCGMRDCQCGEANRIEFRNRRA